MTFLEFLSQISGATEYSRRSKILLFAYYLRKHQGTLEFSIAEIRDCFHQALFKVPADLAQLLRQISSGRASPLLKANRRNYYSLSIGGVNEVETYLAAKAPESGTLDAFQTNALSYLKKVMDKVKEENQRRYLAEAIACLEVPATRATVLMTWAVTIDHMHDYVLKHKLLEFNAALAKRTDRYGKLVVKDKDHFSDIKESVFIEVCRSANIVTNDIRKILEEKLGIRNTCAHPSSVAITITKVASFIEDLVDNIIIKHKL